MHFGAGHEQTSVLCCRNPTFSRREETGPSRATLEFRRRLEYRRAATRQLLPKSNIQYRHFYEYDPADMNFSDHLPTTLAREKADEIYRNLLVLAPLDATYRPEKYFARGAAPPVTERPEIFSFKHSDNTVI